MKLGLSNYTWPWAVGREGFPPEHPLDVPELLARTSRYGVSILQIADIPALHRMNDEQLEAIARAAELSGITLEIGTRGIEQEHLFGYLDIAERLESKIVRTIAERLDDETVTRLRSVLPSYEKAGVCIALENHDEHGTHELASMLDRIGSPFLGVCLDTVNSFAALESPDAVVRTLAPYTVNLHVKDFEIVRFGNELGFSIVGRPAGEGRLDVPWITGYLKEMGRDPTVILEQWPPFTETLEKTVRLEDEWADRSIRYLKRFIE
jgi:sugar phosphate isomerase/epimerase